MGVNRSEVTSAATSIGCSIMNNQFRYLGVMVGQQSSRLSAWDDTLSKLRARLSKWKMKTLSIGGRLTLLKSVLGASPIYNMSLFKVPSGVLKLMEGIRSRFFNGIDQSDKKITWVAWNKVLASKKNGGLGVSSFFALNRALLLKWIWRFISDDGSLWGKVIRSLHGTSIDHHNAKYPSIWCTILRELQHLKNKGFNFWDHCKKRIGNGNSTRFWLDPWLGELPLYAKFPRLFSLELNRDALVASKINSSVVDSFRRPPRGGVEQTQLSDLLDMLESVSLSQNNDRWFCDLTGDGVFRVKEVRSFIDDLFLPCSNPTQWVKAIPTKVNIFAWRVQRDCLPTRINLFKREIPLPSLLCPVCEAAEEDVSHILFRCDLALSLLKKVCRWWDFEPYVWTSFQDWQSWFSSIRLSSKLKSLLEGVFLVTWWFVWRFRNRLIFEVPSPNRSEVFDDIVLTSFNWCKWRCHLSFSWLDWLKNPSLISL